MTAVANQIRSNISPEPLNLLNIGTAKLLRMIGRSTMFAVGTDVTALQMMFLGVTVATRDAFDAGVLPDPSSDFQQSWFYWSKLAVPGNVGLGGPVAQVDFDIRTQRVLRSGFDLVLIHDKRLTELPLEVSTSLRLLWEIY